jgi:hypothetical protein
MTAATMASSEGARSRRATNERSILSEDSLAAALGQHPRPQGDDQAGLLGEGDELGRQEQPPARPVPADQGLDPDQAALLERDDRLVQGAQLVGVDGLVAGRQQGRLGVADQGAQGGVDLEEATVGTDHRGGHRGGGQGAPDPFQLVVGEDRGDGCGRMHGGDMLTLRTARTNTSGCSTATPPGRPASS